MGSRRVSEEAKPGQRRPEMRVWAEPGQSEVQQGACAASRRKTGEGDTFSHLGFFKMQNSV